MKLRKLNKKELLIVKIILYICVAIVMVNITYVTLKIFNDWPDNYYTRVFLLPLIIFVTGIVALLLPFVSYSTSYSTNPKNDAFMLYVGMAAIIIAIITLIFRIATQR